MVESNRVVVHYKGGKVLKGATADFYPNRAVFHLTPAAGGEVVQVPVSSLKAVFFVESFRGNPQRTKLKGFLSAAVETAKGRKIAVRFHDGELLCGYSMTYIPDKKGFFMVPSDAHSNNIRIFVLVDAAAEVSVGPAADALVKKRLVAARAR